MKKLLIIAILSLCAALKLEEMARYDDIKTQNREAEITAQIERQLQAERIDELEKELRLIKTDIEIMQNGTKK